jgi:hypothetical protein
MRRVTTEQLWSSYQELGTLRKVAERHGFASPAAVWERLNAAGYTVRPRGRSEAAQELTVESLASLARAIGLKTAAYQIGSTYDAVRLRLSRAGYDTRGRRK